MGSSTATLLLPLLYLLLATASAISLADFQPINGFSSSCTKAYNTPMKDCSTSDFGDGASCSTQCIAFLEALTDVLNQQCKGTSALPSTLMGLFYISRGTSALCRNVVGPSTDSGNGSDEQDTGTTKGYSKNTAYVTSTSRRAAATSSQEEVDQSTSTSYTSAAPTASTTDRDSSTSSYSSTSSTSTSVPTTKITSTVTSTSTQTANPSTTHTSSSSTSHTHTSSAAAQTTTSSNNGGGGTILDIGSAAPPNARTPIRLLGSLGLIVVSVWMWR